MADDGRTEARGQVIPFPTRPTAERVRDDPFVRALAAWGSPIAEELRDQDARRDFAAPLVKMTAKIIPFPTKPNPEEFEPTVEDCVFCDRSEECHGPCLRRGKKGA